MKRVLCIGFAFAILCANAQRKGITSMKNDQILNVWLSATDRALQLGFEPVPNLQALPPQALADSIQWSQRFLKAAGNPHETKAAVQVSMHRAHRDTPDLIRAQFVNRDIAIDYIEGINFVLLRMTGSGWTPADVTECAFRYLNVEGADHKWVFQVHAPLSNGTQFSSNDETDPMNMFSWSSRVDGGIHHGQLFFLGYKKDSQRAGYKDGQRWFTGSK